MLRFGLPRLPLFAIGLWTEARSVVGVIVQTLRQPKPLLDRLVAAGVALVILFQYSRRDGLLATE